MSFVFESGVLEILNYIFASKSVFVCVFCCKNLNTLNAGINFIWLVQI